MDRREFIKISTIGSSVIFVQKENLAKAAVDEPVQTDGKIDRITLPSACWQCVSRCAIIGYVENNRLVKIDGNPNSRRNEGKVCAKGQAGINQVYHPDRVLYPLKRIGKRGSGKWEKISWEEALGLIVDGGEIEGTKVKGLRTLREEGTPEKFLFHYGRMVGSDYTIIRNYFLNAYGTASIGDHNSICVNAGGIARMLSGDVTPGFPFDEAKFILNFGNSLFEAGFDHVPFVRRVSGMIENGTRLVTFDVRLSNTAAKSNEWIPVKPGTDLAVILALCNVIVRNKLYNKEEFQMSANVTIEELENHLAHYTPQWAEEISGVPTHKIISIAKEFGSTKFSVAISQRGAFMHFNGVQTQRAIYLLNALSGNLGSQKVVMEFPQWDYPFPFPDGAKDRLDLFEGEKGKYVITAGNVSHQICHMIDIEKDKPELYMVYCHNPVYSNGDCNQNARIYGDTKKIPFLVAIDVALSETSELADLVLPDTTYLERWTCETGRAPKGIAEYYIRQPLTEPLGESRNFVDVACDLAARLDLDLGFSSSEEFVRETCNNTAVIKDAGGFDFMRKNGIYQDDNTGTSFVQRRKINIRSEELRKKGFSGIPGWMPIPGHDKLDDNELILTTFKTNVQTHSRTQNCKWLTELFHENPAWINTKTAERLGVENGSLIKINSPIGSLITKARVTQGIHPDAISISNHGGHWAWGFYASGQRSFVHDTNFESDIRNKWWKANGAHVNSIIPNTGDPIAGSMCWNDTVVRIEKV